MAPGAKREKSRGQSIVELALILPLIVLLLALSADFGRAFSAYIAISGAAREGAAYRMQGPGNAADLNGARAAALAETPTLWGVTPQVTFPACSDGMMRPNYTEYDCVAVLVRYDFQPLITIGPIPESIRMERTVQMRVIN